MTRLVIADDHSMFREGLRELLTRSGEFEVVGEAGSAAETMQCVRELAFDVLILDLAMPGRSGVDLVRQVKNERPSLPVLVLSMHAEDQYAVLSARTRRTCCARSAAPTWPSWCATPSTRASRRRVRRRRAHRARRNRMRPSSRLETAREGQALAQPGSTRQDPGGRVALLSNPTLGDHDHGFDLQRRCSD